uniref:Reverse transcriptase zinc-binding domain-containing protein n=1 Tax=Salix viminalis TaxID=40686 RepID=A0A6N2MJB1_SALVM
MLFWKDSWLAHYGPLSRHIIGEIPVENRNSTVADMVDDRGKWKWEEFAHLIPMPIVMGIAGHIPPTQDMIADSMIWDHSPNGNFKTKTAYGLQNDRRLMDQDPIWKVIWQWKGMERIKLFMWTVAHNSIMTNDMRWRRRLTDNRCCTQCINEVETVIHALRDCPKARKIWEVFVKEEERDLFFSQSWYTWMISNLAFRKRVASSMNWPLEFGIILWYIWKERCNNVFGSSQDYNIFQVSKSMAANKGSI